MSNMSKSWLQKAKESDKFIHLAMGWKAETHGNRLAKGAYMWSGLPAWKRIIFSPIYLLMMVQIWFAGCFLGSDWYFLKIKEDSTEKTTEVDSDK